MRSPKKSRAFHPPAPPLRPVVLATLLAGWVGAAHSQDGAGAARFGSFTPSVSASTSYSETRGRGGSGRAGDGEFVTQLSPGLSWSSRAGRVQGSVSYALNLVHYSKQRNADNLQNSLVGQLTVEAIEDRAFVDASASISQQSISPFGTQSVGNGPQAQGNRTEVSSASISPYVRGSLAGLANYVVRLSAAGTRADDQQNSDSDSASLQLSLNSPNTGSVFGWGLNASRQRVDFRVGGESQTDRANLSLFFRPSPELQLGVSGGQESTDVIGTERRSYDNWGWNVRWAPGPRTNLSLQSERRYFGNSHSFLFSHRMRQTVWQYTDTRGATSGSDPNGLGQPVTLFALYFALFTSAQPDPALRELLVLEFLRSIGRQPGELVAGGLLTTALSNQRRQDLSFAINGVRTSFSLLAFRNQTRTLGTSGTVATDLPVRQSGLTSFLTYRLSPLSSATLSASYSATEDSGSQAGNDLSSLALSWNTRLGRHVSTALTGRYSVFDGAESYREAAIVASLAITF